MSSQDLSKRQTLHRDEAFSRAYHTSWIPPLLICAIGVMSVAGFTGIDQIITVTEDVKKAHYYSKPRFGVGPTTCSSYAPWLSGIGITDCTQAITVCAALIITLPIVTHIFTIMTNYKYRIRLSWFNAAVTYVIIMHLEIFAGTQHIMVSYLSLVINVRMIYFNLKIDSFALMIIYMTDASSLIFGGSYNEWFVASNMFLFALFIHAYLFYQLLYRIESRKWDYIHALVVCRERIQKARMFPINLAELHRSPEVLQHLRTNGAYQTPLVWGERAAADPEILKEIDKNDFWNDNNLQNEDEEAHAHKQKADEGKSSKKYKKENEDEYEAIPEKDLSNKSAQDVSTSGKTASKDSAASAAPAAPLNWLDSFIYVLKDPFIEQAIGRGVIFDYIELPQDFLPVMTNVAAKDEDDTDVIAKENSGPTLTFDNFKSRTSVVIGIRLIQASEIIDKEFYCTKHQLNVEAAMFDVVHKLAENHLVSFCRYVGRTWVGTLGYFNSHGSIQKDCHEATLMCCELQHALKPFQCLAECSIAAGNVLCGFMEQQVFDVFGSEVRWVLETCAQAAAKYYDAGVHISENIDEALRTQARIVLAEENPVQIVLASELLDKRVNNEFASEGEIDVNGKSNTDILVRLEPKNSQSSTYFIVNPHEVSNLNEADLERLRALVNAVTEKLHEPKKIDLNPGYNDSEPKISDADFENKMHNPGALPQAARQQDDTVLSFFPKYNSFFQSVYDTHGIWVTDPILACYTDDEWIAMHEKIETATNEIIFEHCYLKSRLRRFFGHENFSYFTGVDTVITSTRTKELNGVVYENTVDKEVRSHPSLAPASSLNRTSEMSFSFVQRSTVDQNFSSLLFSNASRSRKFEPLTYQCAGFADIVWHVCQLIYQSVANCRVIVKFFSALEWVRTVLGKTAKKSNTQHERKKKLVSHVLPASDKETSKVPVSVHLDSSSMKVVRDVTTTTTKTSTTTTTTTTTTILPNIEKRFHNNPDPTPNIEVETEIKTVEKIPAKDGSLFWQCFNSDSRIISQAFSIKFAAICMFQICPAYIIFSREYSLQSELNVHQRFLGKEELFTSAFFGYGLAQLMLERRYNSFMYCVCLFCRVTVVLKYPAQIFDLGYSLKSFSPSSMFQEHRDWAGEIPGCMMLVIFCFPNNLSRISVMQAVIESSAIVVTFYIRKLILNENTTAWMTFPARSIIVAMLVLSIVCAMWLHRAGNFSFIMENKLLPYTIAVQRKYTARAKDAKKLYIPDIITIPAPVGSETSLNNVFDYKTYSRCVVVVVHLMAADVLPAYVDGAYFGEFIGSLCDLVNETIVECRLSRISLYAGTTIAICYDDAVWNHDIPSKTQNSQSKSTPLLSYITRVMIFVQTLQQKFNIFMFINKCSIVWSVGLDHGEASIGMSRSRYRQFDVIGPVREFAVILSTFSKDKGGVFASEAFDQCARLSYLPSMDFKRKEVIINGMLETVYLIENNYFGTTLQDLEHLRIIGSGGYGSVHLVKEKNTGTEYAVKVISYSNASIRGKESLKAEFLFLQQLNHTNIVQFKYCISTNSKFYLVMSCVRGGNLQQICESQQPPIVNLIELFAELVLGLQYLHANGIIHCDVKPVNCLVGTDGHLKITDFGLSKTTNLKRLDSIANSAMISKLLPLKTKINFFSATALVITLDKAISTIQTHLRKLLYSASMVSTAVECLKYVSDVCKPDVLLVEIQPPEFEVAKKFVLTGESPKPGDLTSPKVLEMLEILAGFTIASAFSIDTPESKDTGGKACMQDFFDLGIPVVICIPFPDKELKIFYDKMTKVRACICLPVGTKNNLETIANIAREGREIAQNEAQITKEDDTSPIYDLLTSRGMSFSQWSHSHSESVTGFNPSGGAFSVSNAADEERAVEGTPTAKNEQEQNRPKRKLVGTIYYLAPETIEKRIYTPAIDWWACGVTIYECATRSKLFQGQTKREITRRILAPAPVPLKALSEVSFRQLEETSTNNIHRNCLTPNTESLSDPISLIEHLVKGLLNKNSAERLGSRGGAQEIKVHPFFRSIKWDTVSTSEASFKPPQHPMFHKVVDENEPYYEGSMNKMTAFELFSERDSRSVNETGDERRQTKFPKMTSVGLPSKLYEEVDDTEGELDIEYDESLEKRQQK